MTLRRGHGYGKGVPRIEVLPPDELPPASGSNTVVPQRLPNGHFAAGNTVSQKPRIRPGHRGGAALSAADPAYASFQRWGRKYAAHRRAELAKLHGGSISAGVGALIESAASALAASRFIQMRASATCDPDLFKKASALANDARQNELAAWELSAREAAARPRSAVPEWRARLGLDTKKKDSV